MPENPKVNKAGHPNRPAQRRLTWTQMTSGTITMVAMTAIDSAMMVVQMRGLLDHDDGDDDDTSLAVFADVSGIAGLWVGTQPVPDLSSLS